MTTGGLAKLEIGIIIRGVEMTSFDLYPNTTAAMKRQREEDTEYEPWVRRWHNHRRIPTSTPNNAATKRERDYHPAEPHWDSQRKRMRLTDHELDTRAEMNNLVQVFD